MSQFQYKMAAVLVLVSAATSASAQLSIVKSSIDCGGGRSAAGSFVLSSTNGQADAANTVAAGSFRLTGGFWGTGAGCPVCAADFNNDQGIDGDDVIAFFADWDQSRGCADSNRDGGIDGDDVIFFFESWDAGGC